MISSAVTANAENPCEHMANYLLELSGSNLKEYREAEEKKRQAEVAYYTDMTEKLEEELATAKADAVRVTSTVTELSMSSFADLRSEITERTLNNITADDIFNPCEAAVAEIDSQMDLM